MTIKYKVDDIHCDHYARTIREAIQGVQADARVDVDVAPKTVAIANVTDRKAVEAAIVDAGYELQAEA